MARKTFDPQLVEHGGGGLRRRRETSGGGGSDSRVGRRALKMVARGRTKRAGHGGGLEVLTAQGGGRQGDLVGEMRPSVQTREREPNNNLQAVGLGGGCRADELIY